MARDPNSQTVRPALLWEGGRFVSGREVHVSGDQIKEVTPAGEGSNWNVALLPGFVNVHSHGFQRGLRGMGETFPQGHGSFFTWRDAMYQLVLGLDEDRAYQLSRQAFEEMLDAGFTSAGEFHYIHHAAERAWGLDGAVLAAARDAGIRLVLLQVRACGHTKL